MEILSGSQLKTFGVLELAAPFFQGLANIEVFGWVSF